MSEHYIYVIAVARPGEPKGPVKIGISSNVGARLSNLQTACPYPLELIHVFTAPDSECARHLERGFHEVQAKHRLAGEWFDLDPGIALMLMFLQLEVVFKCVLKFSDEEIDVARQMSGAAAAQAKFKLYGPREKLQ